VINASMGQTCLTSTGLHVVSLSWAASTSSGVTGYQVSRGTSSSGPFTLLSSVGATTTSYLDTTVVSGTTYYYVVAAVAGSSVSANTTPVAAPVPTP
jgi:fibronectin type 3 domain-containing protein